MRAVFGEARFPSAVYQGHEIQEGDQMVYPSDFDVDTTGRSTFSIEYAVRDAFNRTVYVRTDAVPVGHC